MARKTDFECENRINSNQEIEKLIHHLKLNINGVAKVLLKYIYASKSFNHQQGMQYENLLAKMGFD